MNETKKMEMSGETQKEQKTLIHWIREHKMEIAIAGISITAMVRLVLSNIEGVVIPMHSEYKAPFDVSFHIRNLHEGWKASPEKLAKAAAYGIELLPGQTLVEGYTKGKVA